MEYKVIDLRRGCVLFHFSEDASIKVFIPKEKQNRPDFPAVVWAIDEEHEFTYYFPRDCPRIVCRKDEETTDQHLQLFFKNSIADTIVTVESDWYTRISTQTIYRYCFDDDLIPLLCDGMHIYSFRFNIQIDMLSYPFIAMHIYPRECRYGRRRNGR
ncbi:DUF6886 family protein [Paenibacillus lautus]|uniref:DUF6886 family protein n=1 Tax=Paenibacillus lautus TaxID=1401 RepID=UPI003D2E0A48